MQKENFIGGNDDSKQSRLEPVQDVSDTEPSEKTTARTRKYSVLVVDDESSNIMNLLHVLNPTYTVYAAKNGISAIQAAEKYLPDIILLDVLMPEMTGYEVLQRLKSNPVTASIPVVFLTAQSDSASEIKGLSMGAIDYISKPFSPPLLLKRIELHLLVESQRRQLVGFNTNLQKMVEVKTKTVVELQNAVLKTIAELVEWRDDDTGGHIERTQYYLRIMLDAMQRKGIYVEEIASWDIPLVIQSAELHDVGKIAIKDSILKKPGKLTEEEFKAIKTHAVVGERIIDRIKENTTEHSFLEYAKFFAGSHHEKWDGSGYPKGLKGLEIPLQGRLMAIVDVYDALVSERPYKKAFTHEEAVAIMLEGSGKHFDPALIEVFLDSADSFMAVAKKQHHAETKTGCP